MSAEEEKKTETFRVNVVVSDFDKKDGVSVVPSYRSIVARGPWVGDAISLNSLISAAEKEALGSELTDLVAFGKNSVAKSSNVKSFDWTVTAGNVLIASGTNKDYEALKANVDLFNKGNYNNVTLEISLLVDEYSADNVSENGDDIDDRTQETYLVKLEKGIGSGLFTVAGNYTVNEGDDLAKLVKEGEYTNLPGLNDMEFDKDYNEYVYQYTIEDDTIYGRWVKEGSPLFGKVEAEKEYDELDANKDGVVSCEEALGKGWVWNNETSACELKGSSNTGSYVPNTATK